MYTLLLGLHSILRWTIVMLMLVNIIRSYTQMNLPYSQTAKKWNLRLLIMAHSNLLIGLYQYFFGPKGFALFSANGAAVVMKNPEMRFWAVEHITGMILAVVLITISRSIAKKDIDPSKKNKKLGLIYIIAFAIILASIPWPFRFQGIPWFRGF